MATIVIAESFDKAGFGAASGAAHGLDPEWQRKLPTAGGYERTEIDVSPPTYETTTKKHGAGAARYSNNTSSDSIHQWAATTNWGSTFYVGWWAYVVDVAGTEPGDVYRMAAITIGGTTYYLQFEQNLAGTHVKFNFLSSAGSDYAYGTWHYLELRYDGSSLKLYVNGTLEATHGSAPSGNVTNLALGAFQHSTSKDEADLIIDSVIASTDTVIAYADGWVVVACSPDGDDGTDSAFTPSTGSASWSLLDEAPANNGGSADYVSSTSTSQNELVTLDASAIPTDAVIECVKTVLHFSPSTSGDASDLNVRTNDGGTVTNNAMESTLNTARTYQYAVYDNTKPSGGAWTQSAVDAFKIGGRRGSDGAKTANLVIEQAFIEVVYKPAAAAGATNIRVM